MPKRKRPEVLPRSRNLRLDRRPSQWSVTYPPAPPSPNPREFPGAGGEGGIHPWQMFLPSPFREPPKNTGVQGPGVRSKSIPLRRAHGRLSEAQGKSPPQSPLVRIPQAQRGGRRRGDYRGRKSRSRDCGRACPRNDPGGASRGGPHGRGLNVWRQELSGQRRAIESPLPLSRGDVLHHVRRVPPDASQHARGHRVEKR